MTCSIKKPLLIIFALGLSCSHAFADASIKTASELIGCWQRNLYSEKEMKTLSSVEFYDEVQQKYQWFCFNEDGSFRVLTSNNKMKLKDMLKRVKKVPFVMSWQIISPGVIRIENKMDRLQNHNWFMSVAKPGETYNGITLKPGDVYMALPNPEETDFLIMRILKRAK